MSTPTKSVFEYLYRDAGNYKAWGTLLLAGTPDESRVATVRASLESGEYFVAEQVGIPALYSQLWRKCGVGFDPAVDHVWHEFVALRYASRSESDAGPVFASVEVVVAAFERIVRWDERLSPLGRGGE